MSDKVSFYEGCLLGMAVGDAMGYAVDEKTWEEICRDYGPNGLLGYDLVNGSADVTSYTQLAAFAANGLLMGISRSRADTYIKYITLGLREWTHRQHFPRDSENSRCWVAKLPALRRRHCRDARMLDAMRADPLGTPDKPINRNASPGSLTVAAAVGMFYDKRFMESSLVGKLGAEAVALTHGSPDAFLTGAMLACLIAGILTEPERTLKDQVLYAADAVQAQFALRYPRAEELAQMFRAIAERAGTSQVSHRQVMEQLCCRDAHECLCGAIYASLVREDDFDGALILAVNHSGRSGVVGALTGAILGAKLGSSVLPDFYLESLEPLEALKELAADLALVSPTAGLFDDHWDHKYVQGLPTQEHLPAF